MQSKRSSIKTKILIVVLIAVFATAAVISAVSLIRKVNQFNEEITKQTRAIAFIFAATVADQLAEGNKFGALRSLRAIKRVPYFEKILITDEKGRSFAELGSAVILKSSKNKSALFSVNKTVMVPIIKGGVRIGRLTIVVKTDHLYQLLLKDIGMTFLAALFAAAAGILLSFKMQAKITGPIKALTDNMMNIKETQNFSQAVQNYSSDETGQLVDAFNDMQRNIRKRDQKLADHLEMLEQTVEERTHDLLIAKDVAEHANAAKSDFLATMSHEIRTPMNGMLVMAELLASDRLTDQNRRYADVIVKSGQSLLTIINDILDFSKIESGKLELESIELDPSTIVNDVISLFWERANSKGLELAAYVSPDVPPALFGDPVRLNQVLTNLINNALKFTEYGSVSLEILVRSLDPSGNKARLEFAVIDTGIGIPEDKCATIFEAFSQADQSTTRNFGGTGLGLAICQRLVGAMGGKIFVTSKPGEGSRFAFIIDTEIAANNAIHAFVLPEHLETALISTSSPAFDLITCRYLEDFDIAAKLQDHNDISLEDIEASSLFIADARVIEAMDYLQDARLHKQSPYIVCLTSMGEKNYEMLVKQGIVDDILTKPVSRNDMAQLIQRLDQGKPRRASLLEHQSNAQNSFTQFTGAHILIADDSPVNREVAIEALKRLDITCDTVENGRLALEAVTDKDYDAILMDCSMPEMDGFTATRKIRELEQATNRQHHPIIALTAHVAGLPDNNWQSVGMDDYITKPFRLQELADALAAHLPQSQEEQTCLADEALATNPSPAKAPNDENELPIIDDDVMNSYGDFQEDGGAELIARLLKLFLEHAPAAYSQVEADAKGEDQNALAAAAHALKSMSRNIGAVRLANACDRLEQAAGTQQELIPEEYVFSIKKEMKLVQTRIHELAAERDLPDFSINSLS
ncbi:MAG: response regulator [bacterium]|nr:response regulator [bacterium]